MPQRDQTQGASHRRQPEGVGRPDWHNQPAALLLGIEQAIDEAGDDLMRAALLERLQTALAGR